MSYGIWRERGKGWCSLEIDCPHNHTLIEYKFHCYDEGKQGSYWILKNSLDRHQVNYSDDDNPEYLKWLINQVRNQPKRTIAYLNPGGGEHLRWVAYDDETALNQAFDGRSGSPEEVSVIHYEGYIGRKRSYRCG